MRTILAFIAAFAEEIAAALLFPILVLFQTEVTRQALISRTIREEPI